MLLVEQLALVYLFAGLPYYMIFSRRCTRVQAFFGWIFWGIYWCQDTKFLSKNPQVLLDSLRGKC